MSWILKQLGGALGPYIMVALAVVLVGLTITTKVLWSSNTALQGELAVEKASVKSLGLANGSNQKTIKTLREANEEWSKLFDGQKEKDERAVRDQEAFNKRLAAAEAAMSGAINRERKEPDCAAIMAIDIQRACPATVERMRGNAAGSSDRNH